MASPAGGARRRKLAENAAATDLFLERVTAGDTASNAAAATGYDYSSFNALAKKDPAFKERYQEARAVRMDVHRTIVEHETIRRLYEGAVEEVYEPDQDGEMVLVRRTVKRSPADVSNAIRIYGLEHAHEGGGADDRTDQIAEALERFTSTVVSLATRGRAALPAGDPD